MVQTVTKSDLVFQLASTDCMHLVLPRKGLMPARRKEDEKLPTQLLACPATLPLLYDSNKTELMAEQL